MTLFENAQAFYSEPLFLCFPIEISGQIHLILYALYHVPLQAFFRE